tara:strand:+ start:350 stop:511 length:162 start_codon:yes stop_codon:yes gene_type:complete
MSVESGFDIHHILGNPSATFLSLQVIQPRTITHKEGAGCQTNPDSSVIAILLS